MTAPYYLLHPRTTDTQWRHKSKKSENFGRCGKYAAAKPKNLGVGVDFRSCSEGDFLTGHPESVLKYVRQIFNNKIKSPLALGNNVNDLGTVIELKTLNWPFSERFF